MSQEEQVLPKQADWGKEEKIKVEGMSWGVKKLG